MKKQLGIIIGMTLTVLSLANGPFEKAMGSSIPVIFTAEDPDNLQAVINKLERIGKAEGNRWEPFYYTAFGYIRMSGMSKTNEDKDRYLDLAMEAVTKANGIQPNDSEITTMEGYVYMLKLTVDPATRGMEYSGKAFGSFQKAVALNPENPRAHYLLGRMKHGTAQFMGGTSEEACKSLATAISIFEKEDKKERSFAPSWGKDSAIGDSKALCGKE
ncbi:MAG: hypothetical protein AAF551_09730 [Bacteroidota bacterium]